MKKTYKVVGFVYILLFFFFFNFYMCFMEFTRHQYIILYELMEATDSVSRWVPNVGARLIWTL